MYTKILQQRFHPVLAIVKLLVVMAFMGGCANESTPMGGKEDTAPPELKSVIPTNKTTRFTGNKVEFTFNEFLQAGGFAQTLISPPLEQPPVFRANRNKLIVLFKSPLKPNTTYTINFGDDIKDLNAGNSAANFTYVFSTGDYIDSQSVSGNVIDAATGNPVEGVVMSLYPEDSLNAIKTTKPIYFTKTDKSGNYKIENVKAARYQIYGLKDQNYNYRYDQPNELIGFADQPLNLTDSNREQVNLIIFPNAGKHVSLQSVKSLEPGKLLISYTAPIRSLQPEGGLLESSHWMWYYATRDTAIVWYSNPYEETATLKLTANDTLQDTVRIKLNFFSKDTAGRGKIPALSIINEQVAIDNKSQSEEKINIQPLYDSIKISLSRPIVEISAAKQLQIVDDSAHMGMTPQWNLKEKTRQNIMLYFPRKASTRYTLQIPDSMFKDVFGLWNKPISWKFTTNAKDNYGNVALKLTIADASKNYVIDILNSAGDVVQNFHTTGTTEYKQQLNNLPAGTYRISYIEDNNHNGKWDTGNFEERIQPEKAYTFKEIYTLKGGWDLDIEVKF